MKLCTRTINVKNGVRKGFYEWVFLENYFALTPSNIDVTNYSESFITTVTTKLYSIAITSCLKWTFDLFLKFFDINSDVIADFYEIT